MTMLLSHPTGNAFVRALLIGLIETGELDSFHTTLSFEGIADMLPASLQSALERRRFPVPAAKIHANPMRELTRLLAPKLGLTALTRHEFGWASTDAVYQELDGRVAKYLVECAGRQANGHREKLSACYSYEDASLASFEAAKKFGLKCFYDLPIAYWETTKGLLEEEAKRLPDWESTLYGTNVGIRDSVMKLERKTREIELADVVVCPSKFVLESLPDRIRAEKVCVVAEFGTPNLTEPLARRDSHERLRILFAGSMSQRKGLADVFAAVNDLKRADVELVVMGSLVAPMEFYRKHCERFIYEKPRSHSEVLRLMQSCDVLVLPSIVEGRALVQQEAMICGLPLIVTANAGGEDLIEEGKTGFLVPIRSPAKVAEKINWFAENPREIPTMGELARHKAMQVTWESYRRKILNVIVPLAKGEYGA
jgi:glycosyltransferase involved in cell wall biosynthesis